MQGLKHIYLDEPLNVSGTLTLPKEVAHRLTRVLRFKEGQELAIFNGRDGLVRGVMGASGTIEMAEQLQEQPSATSKNLFICLPKKDTFSRVLRQATEMNVSDIYPLFSTYTVPDKLNLTRCQSILVEAAEQCERLTLPTLHAPQNLKEVSFPEGTLWAAERSGAPTGNENSLSASGILIGPEGGFSPEEVEHLAGQESLTAFSLGETILRTDTAVVAGLARV